MEAENKQLSPSSYKKPALIAAFSVLLITFIIYLPALQNGFLNWDDNIYVYENKNIQSIDFGLLRWSFTARVMDLWHPLSFLSFAFDYAVWGLKPTGYHLTNILLHTLNAVLVYLLSIRLIRYGNNAFYKRAIIAGFIASLLFGIHPLRVESVVWVSERKDVLCTFFFLLSLCAYLRHVSGLKRSNYAACLIFYALALLSKPMAISLPIVLLILDYYPLRRLINKEDIRTAVMGKIPFFLAGALVVMITLWPNSSPGAADTGGYPVVERMAIFLHGVTVYLSKTALPINLAPLYPYPSQVIFLDYKYIGSAILVLLISSLCISSIRQGKVFFCVWLYYIATLLPVIGVIGGGPHSMADRYTYLPSIGPFLLVGLGIAAFFERCPKNRCRPIVIGALILLTALLGLKTVRQTGIWKDSISLWSYEIKLYPSYVAYNNRGQAYNSLGDYEAALKDHNKTIELNPRYADGYYARGNVYFRLENYRRAVDNYTVAIQFKTKYYKEAYSNRGIAFFNIGEYQRAIDDFDFAIRLDPEDRTAYDNREIAYQEIGRK